MDIDTNSESSKNCWGEAYSHRQILYVLFHRQRHTILKLVIKV